MKVKFDDLEVLQACDIDQNLKFLHAFWLQKGLHLRLDTGVPISGGLKLTTVSKFRVKTSWILFSYPRSIHKVKFDDLEVLQVSDSDQNLKFRHAFLSQNVHHFRFRMANLSVKKYSSTQNFFCYSRSVHRGQN